MTLPKLIDESLSWLDNLARLAIQIEKTPDATHAELAESLDLPRSMVTFLSAIRDCFDAPAIAKVRRAEKANHVPGVPNAVGQSNFVAPLTGTGQLAASQQMPFTLSFTSARALSRLNKKVKPEDLPGLVHAALDVILARQLATKDIKKLVVWLISGKPASEFDPKAKSVRLPSVAQGVADAATTPTTLDLKKLRQLLEKAEAERIQGKETTAQENLDKYLQKLYSSNSSSKNLQNTSGSKRGFSETIMLDWLADISVIAQIKSKIKKGKPITRGEVALLWLHKAGEIVGHGIKGFLKLFKPFFKIIHWAWKMVIEALKELGIYKYAKAIMTLVVLIAVIWFAWAAFHYGVIRPVEMIWSKIHIFSHSESAPAPSPSASIPTPAPQTPISVGFGQQKRVSRPVLETQKYQPSIPFQPSVEDPLIHEDEIEAIKPKSHVNDHSVIPDEGIPGDVAVSRLRDLADPDKYTMKIGKDKQAVLSANVTTTGLTINYKSPDLFGAVTGSGGGQWNALWEDINAIHVSEIVSENNGPVTYFQISAITEGAKIPLTFQCATKANLQHLVSALEYFIRNSRLGHDAQPGGLPYPNQGMVLNNDVVVDKLWTNSPADKAGVDLGDHLWCIGKITSEQQSKKDLEAGLPSASILYVVSPEEWIKAQTAVNSRVTNIFRPKLRKVTIGQ